MTSLIKNKWIIKPWECVWYINKADDRRPDSHSYNSNKNEINGIINRPGGSRDHG